MGSYTVVASADYRNEGWSLGGGVVSLTNAWNNDDDGKYASAPSNRGRAAVRFPIDISTSNIPAGAAITSVTIKIRVRKTSSAQRSCTVNVLSTENTSRYTSRTLYPTTSFADYEVGTYTVDPVGKPWDRDRLNKLAVQVFSYSVPPNDGIRVAKLYATINFKERPTVKVTAPSGTVSSPSPNVTWTYTQEDGDLQKSAEYKVFTATQVNATAFNPDTATPTYGGTVQGDITSFKLPTALTPDAYYLYVRATSVFDSVSAWHFRTFTVNGASPGVPGGGVGGIGVGGGGGFESVIADSETSNAFLTLRDGSNLLSVQQASFETTTDSLGYVGDNCALAYDSSVSYQGQGSMSMTASSAGDMAAETSYIEVAPRTAITARAQSLADADGRDVTLIVRFYDDAFNQLAGADISSTPSANSDDTWTEFHVSGTTPNTPVDQTLYAKLVILVEGADNGEKHNFDQIGLMYGTDSQWSHGGHMSRNILSSAASTADDPVTDEPWGAGNGASSLARVAAQGIGSEGEKMFAMTYEGTSPTISHVGNGAAYTSTSSGTGYTLNKPGGSPTDGDVYVAYVAADTGEPITPPDGWTLVDSVTAGTGNSRTGMWVLMKDAADDDPSSWVGNLGATCTRIRAAVVAYRGAAPVEDQFQVSQASGTTSTSTVAQTPALSNDVDGAWRLSAFALRDDTASAGSMTANTQPPATPPPISYVGRGANWWYGGAQGTYQLNKPSGLQQNDVILAFGSFSGTATPSSPGTGWTQIRRIVKTNGNGDDHSGTVTFVIWRKVAGSSEPSSWTSSYTGTGTPLMTQTVAYRNVDTSSPILAENFGSAFSNSTGTGSVTNTDAKAWRVSAFTFTTNYGEGTSSNEVTERADFHTDVGAHPDVQIGVYDSNGPVSTGSHSRSGNVTGYYNSWAAVGWICLLRPTAAVSPGANENERADAGAASGTANIHLAAYDNVADSGEQRVYGNYIPSSGTTILSSCGWLGFLLPDAPTTAGEVAAQLIAPVDISDVPQAVIDRSEGKVTFQSAFLGSTAGQPFLKVLFYNGNELIATRTAAGQSFNETTWVKSVASFEVPASTTRIGLAVSATDREIDDEVYFDRVSLAFGTDTVWRRGTSRTEHPIFNVPVIEYAEDKGDGYSDWLPLGGSERALLRYDQLTGTVTYVDQMLTPLARRKYRAKTVSYGLEGDTFASGYGDESDEISLVGQDWWIKDPNDPEAALKIKVKSESFKVTTASTAAVFQALGADRPVVLTEGYKGETFSIKVICDRLQYAAIKRKLNERKTLFLQSNLDQSWWVRPIGDIGSEVQETYRRHEDPLRFVELTFTEVDPE